MVTKQNSGLPTPPSQRFSALEAHRRALENLHGPVVEPYLDLAYANIDKAVEKGRLECHDPWYPDRDRSTGVDWPSHETSEAVKKALRDAGFTVEDKPDPDPGHPCSRAYTLVSW